VERALFVELVDAVGRGERDMVAGCGVEGMAAKTPGWRRGSSPEAAKRRGSTVAIPLAAAIVFSWGGLLFTVKAAPIILGIAGSMIPQP
jgi:hypothetical protein